METELDNWTNKYDDFMEQQNGRIQAIQEEYDEEKADLADLKDRFTILKGRLLCFFEKSRLVQRSMMQSCTNES